jgi:MFS family permease
VATIGSGWTARVHRHGLMVLIAAALWGVGIVGVGLSDTLWLTLFCLAFAGGADMVSGLFRMIIWNQTIPDHLRGRLAGIEMLSYTTGPLLGQLRAGAMARTGLGVAGSIWVGGVLCVAGSLALAAALPKFLRYNGEHGMALKKAADDEWNATADARRSVG